MPSRRTVLTAGALLAVAGCSALGSANARLARVRLTNAGSRTRAFEFTVRVDSETMYDETHTVPADGDGTTVELVEELPDEQGSIAIETAIVGTGLAESTTLGGDRCYDVVVEYTGDNVVHWQSGSEAGCETVL